VEHDFKKVFEDKYFDRIQDKIHNLLKRNIFQSREVRILLKDFRNNFHLIMKLYTLEVWFESFID
jgi:hypothetical protein